MADRVTQALEMVEAELRRATDRFGPFASAHEGYAVILEELDELWEEIKADRGDQPPALSEVKQVAAMALRYMVDICV